MRSTRPSESGCPRRIYLDSSYDCKPVLQACLSKEAITSSGKVRRDIAAVPGGSGVDAVGVVTSALHRVLVLRFREELLSFIDIPNIHEFLNVVSTKGDPQNDLYVGITQTLAD